MHYGKNAVKKDFTWEKCRKIACISVQKITYAVRGDGNVKKELENIRLLDPWDGGGGRTVGDTEPQRHEKL